MNENIEKIKDPSVSDFLNIYPPLSTNVNTINDSKKFLIYFGQLKQKNQKSAENSKNEIFTSHPHPYPILLEKILKQQKTRNSRTQDMKDAIKLFLLHSDLIQKLQSYFSNQNTQKDYYEYDNNDNNENNNLVNLNEHIEKIISRLTDSVILEKYEKNKFIVKYGDIGHNCYFLLSGKISILKPVQYKDIKISYHDYLKYLSNLFANDEMYFALKVLELNNETYFKFHNLDYIREDINNLKSFIKSYCIILLYRKIKSDLIDYTNISTLENFLNEFNFTFKDFNINSNSLTEHINQLNQDNNVNPKTNSKSKEKLEKKNINAQLKKYILEIFSPSEDDTHNMKPYELLLFKNISNNNKLNSNQNQKNILNETAILYKYETVMNPGPGVFFGEMALDVHTNKNKRNATIRTEEECFLFSLTQKLYNSILLQSINFIKEFDIAIIKRNYFFGEINQKIFDKMYYSMFKLISKEKNEFIYRQNSLLNSIYFLKEGKIKLEINLSVIDIYNIIKYYLNYIGENRRLFNFTDEQIYELNKTYLSDYKDLYLGNKLPMYKNKISEIKKYEIYNVTNFEALGLLEFMSKNDIYNTSCFVISKTAKIFEISKDNLEILINREKKGIINDYYKFAKDRFLVMIKRLHSIKYNCLSHIKYKIKENFLFHNEIIANFFNSNNENNEQKNDNESENNRYNHNIDDKIEKEVFSKRMKIDRINIKRYENISSSLKKNKILSKKIKLPHTKRNNYIINDYNKIETQKSNNLSGTPIKNMKFNEDYFIKNKSNLFNSFSNSNNNTKRKENNEQKKSNINEITRSIIKILLSPDIKKIKSENVRKIPKAPLNLIKNYKSKDLINMGNNNFLTLEKLKTKLNEKIIDKNMLDLSIVKNEQKNVKKSPTINYDISKLKLNLYKRNAFSPFYFHNSKLKKIMLLHNKDNSNSNNISYSNFSSLTNITNINSKKMS